MSGTDPAAIAHSLLTAFSAADLDGMRDVLAEDLTAYVTRADGGMDEVVGRNEYLGRLESMDLPTASFTVELTQPPVIVGSDQVLVMVEIRAEREGRALTNFAAHLLRVADERVTHWWMADAKPAESDEFWS